MFKIKLTKQEQYDDKFNDLVFIMLEDFRQNDVYFTTNIIKPITTLMKSF